MGEYENRMMTLNQEIERLNGILKIKVDENASYEGRLRSLSAETEQLRRVNSEYELKLTQINQEWQMKMSSF